MGQECEKASGRISEGKAPGALSDKHTPVSYTHLDVYKRQISDCYEHGFKERGNAACPTVCPTNYRSENFKYAHDRQH